MTPFVAWSQARFDVPSSQDGDGGNESSADSGIEFDEELSMMMDEIIQNLMTSTSLQLRRTLKMMEDAREEQRRKSQDNYVLKQLSAIEEKTAAIVADALTPVLSDLQLSQIMKQFVSMLKRILPEFSQQSLCVSAPAELHAKLNDALQSQAVSAEVTTNDNVELLAAGEQVVLRADLRQWSKNLGMVAGL
jgi:KaiC/GvpD/RAD55 family RecA-like ATPase